MSDEYYETEAGRKGLFLFEAGLIGCIRASQSYGPVQEWIAGADSPVNLVGAACWKALGQLKDPEKSREDVLQLRQLLVGTSHDSVVRIMGQALRAVNLYGKSIEVWAREGCIQRCYVLPQPGSLEARLKELTTEKDLFAQSFAQKTGSIYHPFQLDKKLATLALDRYEAQRRNAFQSA